MNDTINKMLFEVLGAVCSGRPLAESFRQGLSDENIAKMISVAKQHDLSHIVAFGLYENGLVEKDSEWYPRLEREQIQGVFRYEQTKYTFDELRELFESAQIVYMPLKGSVIRAYYPQPWLRTSCDIDILINEQDLERASELLTAEGWTRKGKNFHDVSFFSPAGIHLELHYNITEQIRNIDTVLEQVWDHCLPVDGRKYERVQTNEFLMYHLIAHMSYHFISGGCGIRPFIDIWLLRGALGYDEEKLKTLLRTAKLDTFYANVCELIDVWFEGKEHSALSKQIESFILGGGVYGTTANRVMLEQAQSGTKAKNIRFRLFMPYSLLKQRYPVLVKHKWLTPVFWVVRWFDTVRKGRLKSSVNELKENNSHSGEDIKAAERFLKSVGLNEKNR
jgi:hypothetical protein